MSEGQESNEEQEMRLEALRLAVHAQLDARNSVAIVLAAKNFHNYIKTGAPDMR